MFEVRLNGLLSKYHQIPQKSRNTLVLYVVLSSSTGKIRMKKEGSGWKYYCNVWFMKCIFRYLYFRRKILIPLHQAANMISSFTLNSSAYQGCNHFVQYDLFGCYWLKGHVLFSGEDSLHNGGYSLTVLEYLKQAVCHISSKWIHGNPMVNIEL